MGRGQHLDLALLDCQVAVLAYQAMNYRSTGVAPGRSGNVHPNIVPYQPFRTADGNVIIACSNDNLFRKFCDVAGCQHIAQDPRFATNADRVRQRETLIPLLVARMKQRRRADWLAALEAAKVPCGPINELAQVFADPQVRARGLRLDLPHPLAGRVPQVGPPFKLSGTLAMPDRAPPLLAEHTEQVLRERLGLADAAIARLTAAGVVGVR